MRLYLIRHGQSTNNALKDMTQRVQDPELTDIGHEQTHHLAKFLQEGHDGLGGETGFNITHLYCSAMHRALQTARPVAEALGITPEIWLEIHEAGGIFLRDPETQVVTGYGGLTRQQIESQFPGYVLPETITERGWWRPEMGEETRAHLAYRAIQVAQALRDQVDSDRHVALISHGAFLDRLIKALLNQLPAEPAWLFYAHYNTGITRFDFGDWDDMRMHYLNRVDHLGAPLRTW